MCVQLPWINNTSFRPLFVLCCPCDQHFFRGRSPGHSLGTVLIVELASVDDDVFRIDLRFIVHLGLRPNGRGMTGMTHLQPVEGIGHGLAIAGSSCCIAGMFTWDKMHLRLWNWKSLKRGTAKFHMDWWSQFVCVPGQFKVIQYMYPHVRWEKLKNIVDRHLKFAVITRNG